MVSSKDTIVYTIWAEWDLGHEGRVFSTHQSAIDSISMYFGDEDSELQMSIDEAMSAGLLHINSAKVE